MAKVVALIETDDLKGGGEQRSPYRRVKQWFTIEGKLVVQQDPCVEGNLREASEILQKLLQKVLVAEDIPIQLGKVLDLINDSKLG